MIAVCEEVKQDSKTDLAWRNGRMFDIDLFFILVLYKKGLPSGNERFWD